MFIDTRSRESMESSMSTYLDIPVDELYQYINYAAEKAQKDQRAFNIDVFFEELGTIISDFQPEIEIDELLFFHLSRRLHGTEDDSSGRNLENLLTTKNALSDFLRAHQIEFTKGEQNIITYYKGQQVLIEAINTIQLSETVCSPFRRSAVRREGWEAARKADSLHRRRGSDGR